MVTRYSTTLTPFSLLTFLRVPQPCLFPTSNFKVIAVFSPHLQSTLEAWSLGVLESWTPDGPLLGIEMFLSHRIEVWPLLICRYVSSPDQD